MRRSSVSWLLSLLLLFAQCGAVLHELGHLSEAQRSHGATLSAGLDAGSPFCATCEAYGQFANPAGASVHAFHVPPPVLLPTAAPVYGSVGVDVPTPRSRGPPPV
jgi:hypothetical protein